jgi:cobalt/nickel transport system ATP-binding protein
MDENSVIIHLKDICFTYPGGGPVADHLDFTLRKGEWVGLTGPNGSGKTTFLHIIMGLLRPSAGTVHIFGKPMESKKDLRLVRRRVGLLFQDPDDQLFSPTVLEDVAFGPLNLDKSPAEARRISQGVLAELGLEGYGDRVTYTLSMGEKRLVSLATVLAMQPDVLLLDEPTSGLDETTRTTMIDVLNRFDGSCVTVSHDREFLCSTTQRLYVMKDRRIEPAGDGRCQGF